MGRKENPLPRDYFRSCEMGTGEPRRGKEIRSFPPSSECIASSCTQLQARPGNTASAGRGGTARRLGPYCTRRIARAGSWHPSEYQIEYSPGAILGHAGPQSVPDGELGCRLDGRQGINPPKGVRMKTWEKHALIFSVKEENSSQPRC